MRVQIDEARCQGHTMCAMHAPEIFGTRDHDGHAVLLVDGDVPVELHDEVNEAVEGCPERAISLTP